jgi:hypothetical protein
MKFKTQSEIWNYLQANPGNMVKRTIDPDTDIVSLRDGNALWLPDGQEPVSFEHPWAWEPYISQSDSESNPFYCEKNEFEIIQE